MIFPKIDVFAERERESKRLRHAFDDIISVENLLLSWKEFLKGKRKRTDVLAFSLKLGDNIFDLHKRLSTQTYKHGGYFSFKISDPKPRNIHKAKVADRLVHHAIYRIIYPFFDNKFIFDSYSCRKGKGVHKAVNRLRQMSKKVSKNNSKTTWILKCDIVKFFANIDHRILKKILEKYIYDEDVMWLLGLVVDSFETQGKPGVGLPLGNLTSQLLVNIYMNEFDQFIKRKLKIKYYIRYADDFVILSEDKKFLTGTILDISEFLDSRLHLCLHPNKVLIRTLASGVDFLGWTHFPHHRTLRKSTKRKMLRKLKCGTTKAILNSYLGLLSHGNTYKLAKLITKDQ